MKLDESGVKAAKMWAIEEACDDGVSVNEYIDGIIRAYLSAIPYSPVSELVERLQSWDHCWPAPGLENAVAEAASTLTTLSTRNAELERQIDRLAAYIMENVPGEPSENQGAVDTAIRLLGKNAELEREVKRLREAQQWQSIETAPKDGTEIIYVNKFSEIGFCYWSKAGGAFDQSMWWDDLADDECCPVAWLPRDTLPAAPQEAEQIEINRTPTDHDLSEVCWQINRKRREDAITPEFLREIWSAIRYCVGRTVTAPQEAEAVAWMNAEHVRDYQAGATDGIAWANYEKTDFYTVPLYTHTRKAEPVAVVVGHHVTQGPNVEFLTDNVSVGTKLYASPAAPRSAALCEVESEDRMDALPYPDEAFAADVLAYVLSCARLWQPEARIIGNARAGDIVRALTHPPAPAVTEGMVSAFIERYELGGSHRCDRSRVRAALQAAQEVKP